MVGRVILLTHPRRKCLSYECRSVLRKWRCSNKRIASIFLCRASFTNLSALLGSSSAWPSLTTLNSHRRTVPVWSCPSSGSYNGYLILWQIRDSQERSRKQHVKVQKKTPRFVSNSAQLFAQIAIPSWLLNSAVWTVAPYINKTRTKNQKRLVTKGALRLKTSC